MKCKARQYSDQMMCSCGLAWDMGDEDPHHRGLVEPVTLHPNVQLQEHWRCAWEAVSDYRRTSRHTQLKGRDHGTVYDFDGPAAPARVSVAVWWDKHGINAALVEDEPA